MNIKSSRRLLMPLYISGCLVSMITGTNAIFFHTDIWLLNVAKNSVCLFTSIVVACQILDKYYRHLYNSKETTETKSTEYEPYKNK